MNTTRMTAIQSSDAGTACCRGQASAVFIAALVLPKSSRAAWVMVETGFHSATTRSGAGRSELSRKALETNTSGNETMVATLLKLSGVRRASATVAVTHENA